MIYHTNTVAINPGKMGAAMAWMAKAVAHLREHHGVEASVLRNLGGASNEVHFLTRHDSLTTFDAYIAAVSADEALGAILMEAVNDRLWDKSEERFYRTAF